MFQLRKYRGQLVFLLDILIYIVTSSILYLFSDFPFGDFYWFARHMFCMVVLFSIFQIILRTYDSLWRYAETREYTALLAGMVLSVAIYLSIVHFLNGTRLWIMQTLASSAVSLLVMLLVRFSYRIYRTHQIGYQAQGRSYLAIIGAGSAGANLLHEIQLNRNTRFIPYCFLDDDPSKFGKSISGVPIKGPIDALQEILRRTPVTDVLLAIPSLSAARRREILNLTQPEFHIADPVLFGNAPGSTEHIGSHINTHGFSPAAHSHAGKKGVQAGTAAQINDKFTWL